MISYIGKYYVVLYSTVLFPFGILSNFQDTFIIFSQIMCETVDLGEIKCEFIVYHVKGLSGYTNH